MSILFVSQRAYPEMGGGMVRDFEYAKHLKRSGHEVTFLTAVPNYPMGKPYEGYAKRFYQDETIDGIHFARVWVYMTPNRGLFKRMLSYSSFVLSACFWGILKIRKCDVTVCTVMPVGSDVAAWILSAIKRSRFVYQMADLMPDAAFHSGVISSSMMRLASRGYTFLLNRADKIIVVRNENQDVLVSRGVSKDKICVIPEGANIGCFRPGMKDPRFTEEYALENKFVILYLGALGIAQGLDIVIKVADSLRDNKKIVFVIGGAGIQEDYLKGLIVRIELDNVRFIGFQHQTLVPRWLQTADVCLVHVRKMGMPDGSIIPSKTFQYMSTGRPVIFAVAGTKAQDFIESSKGGIWIEPDNPEILEETIIRLSESSELTESMGNNAREYIKQHHSLKELSRLFCNVLE